MRPIHWFYFAYHCIREHILITKLKKKLIASLITFTFPFLHTGSPIDCAQSNPCSQRCISSSQFDTTNFRQRHRISSDKDRCDCFAGYKLAPDGVNCVDIDECKLNQHSCNKQSEVCDNTRGGFRCLARQNSLVQQAQTTIGRSLLTPFSDQDSGGEFVSLRLCPLGSRWNSEEKRCISASNSQMNVENHHHLNHARSASLFASSSSSLHLLPERAHEDGAYSSQLGT